MNEMKTIEDNCGTGHDVINEFEINYTENQWCYIDYYRDKKCLLNLGICVLFVIDFDVKHFWTIHE